MMSTQITSAEAKTNLENLCTRAVENGELIVITRHNGKNAVLISEAELESLLETLYLLRSPANATRLLTALKRAKSRVTQPQTLNEICTKFGLDEEADELEPSEQVMLEGML
jgi:antitoxin YefM